MGSVAERVAAERVRLLEAGFSPGDAALDTEVLARHVLGFDRAAFLARARDPEPAGFAEALRALVSRRVRHEPVAHITGHREFYGLEFEVTPAVLIPRPETEMIVEEALQFAQERPVRHLIDVGTGSGCIAIAIAHEVPSLRVTATDASAEALAVAHRNAVRHGVAGRFEFRRTDVLAGVTETADLIVSNPPYVAEADAARLPPEVVEFEPWTALFGGPTGCEVIERLFAQAPGALADGGRLVVEFGFGQAGDVVALAKSVGWRVVRVRNDLQSIPRTLVLERASD